MMLSSLKQTFWCMLYIQLQALNALVNDMVPDDGFCVFLGGGLTMEVSKCVGSCGCCQFSKGALQGAQSLGRS